MTQFLAEDGMFYCCPFTQITAMVLFLLLLLFSECIAQMLQCCMCKCDQKTAESASLLIEDFLQRTDDEGWVVRDDCIWVASG